jgi:hypothetical protein
VLQAIPLFQIMPPSISGVVCNINHGQHVASVAGNKQRTQNKTNGTACSSYAEFDATEFLTRRKDLFKVDKDRVMYLGAIATPKEVAASRLRHILAEGTFLYFFAKFCHGPTFDIKMSYYSRSEPIRSALLLTTGACNVKQALSLFFQRFRSFFNYHEETGRLTITIDFFKE